VTQRQKLGLLTTVNSLDTNIVLRFLLNDNPNQANLATKLITNEICYITDVVLVEVTFVLEKVFELSRADVHELILSFLGFSSIVYNTLFINQVFALYKEQSKLSVVDCYVTCEAQSYQNELFTFDKALAKHGGVHIEELQ